MRVFVLAFFVGLTCGAPQGYNYQLDIDSTGNYQAIPNQYQYIQQQQQPQIVYQQQFSQLPQLGQTVSLDQQGGYQVLQNAQQVIQNEQQQQHQIENPQEIQQYEQQQQIVQAQQIPQQPEIEQYEQQHLIVTPQKVSRQQENQELATVVEEPPTEIVEIITAPKHVVTIEPPKPVEKPQIVIESQPEFIIQSKKPSKPEPIYHAPTAQEKTVTYQKEFYYLSAPKEEDDEETPKDLEDQLTTLKKNLRVVFIKAPENNSLEKAALKFAQQSANSQTAIYVLSKQHDASDLTKKLQSIQSSTPQRPDVQFIKYRTPEEAEHAQRVIQAQYEALDGPNHINRPGTAVTHNFVGANGVEPRKPSPVVAGEKFEFKKPVSKYLPTAAKH